jgi:hypothetical protein
MSSELVIFSSGTYTGRPTCYMTYLPQDLRVIGLEIYFKEEASIDSR